MSIKKKLTKMKDAYMKKSKQVRTNIASADSGRGKPSKSFDTKPSFYLRKKKGKG